MKHHQNRLRQDFWLIILAAVAWGTVGVATQAIYKMGPTNALSLAFWRLALATPLFLVGAWKSLRGKWLQIKQRDLWIMLLMGLMQALYQASYTGAISFSGVTVSTLIALCGAPMMVVLFTAAIKKERLDRITVIALMAALTGSCLLVISESQPDAQPFSLPGVGLAFLAAFGYASFILLGRGLAGRYAPLQVNAIAFGSGALMLWLVMLPKGLVLSYSPWGWMLIFYLGIVPTALAYSLFQTGMRSVSATVVSILTLCEPLTAAILAWLLFHEELGPGGIVGAVLLISAVILLSRERQESR